MHNYSQDATGAGYFWQVKNQFFAKNIKKTGKIRKKMPLEQFMPRSFSLKIFDVYFKENA
jgi:hypothetical protein